MGRKLLASDKQCFATFFADNGDGDFPLGDIEVEQDAVLPEQPQLSFCDAIRPQALYVSALFKRIHSETFQCGCQNLAALSTTKVPKIIHHRLFE